MLYKVGIRILAVVTWTVAVTAFVCYMYEGLTFRTCELIVVAAIPLSVMTIMMTEHRSKMKNRVTAPSSLFNSEPEPYNVPLHAVAHPDDSNHVVMWYKGEPFDFVHNDPTAPYMA